ncbi:MAG: bifunctional diaminohydroxyphosphoribosylaminopyrimidine deaminase/5-amino-6-(5-phosphoribosylamino)uracil reductase RibD [Coriobacteriia bacterium]
MEEGRYVFMTLFSDPSVGMADSMLQRAYALAEQGRGTTSPNPLVGCVLVRDGQIVAEGFHVRAGSPHAEAAALAVAGARASGSHAYVTLEPCAHFGRTPPCVDALIAAGVAEVTIGMPDPTNEAGGGARVLESAGVRVHWADDPAPFEAQNEAWLTRVRQGRPFVRVKVAVTLDGRLALAARRRSAITGDGGRAVTMRLRREATAVAVGAATVDVDNPRLTAREPDGSDSARTPRRFVLSRTSVPPVRSCMFADGNGCTLVTSTVVPARALEELRAGGVRVLIYPYTASLPGALAAIAADGVNDVLVEAGPSMLSALWEDGLIDELVVLTAGGMGGNAAPPLFLGQADAEGDALVPRFLPVEIGIVEGDAVTVWRPQRERALGKGMDADVHRAHRV